MCCDVPVWSTCNDTHTLCDVAKNSLAYEGLASALSSWKEISEPWLSCLVGVFAWRLGTAPDIHKIMYGREPAGSQPCLCDQISIKPLDLKLSELPSWQSCMSSPTPVSGVGVALPGLQGRELEAAQQSSPVPSPHPVLGWCWFVCFCYNKL